MPSSPTGLVQSPSVHRLVYAGTIAWIAILGGTQAAGHDPILWEWIATFALGTFVLVGPATWAVRDQYSAERRTTLAYLFAGIALLCAPIAIGFALLFGGLTILLDAGVLGGAVGLALAFVVEHTILPERLRTTWS